jgi:hypothetical protein
VVDIVYQCRNRHLDHINDHEWTYRYAYITLALLPLVAACAAPREACIASANKDLRVINKLVTETRGNLVRGFAIET